MSALAWLVLQQFAQPLLTALYYVGWLCMGACVGLIIVVYRDQVRELDDLARRSGPR